MASNNHRLRHHAETAPWLHRAGSGARGLLVPPWDARTARGHDRSRGTSLVTPDVPTSRDRSPPPTGPMAAPAHPHREQRGPDARLGPDFFVRPQIRRRAPQVIHSLRPQRRTASDPLRRGGHGFRGTGVLRSPSRRSAAPDRCARGGEAAWGPPARSKGPRHTHTKKQGCGAGIGECAASQQRTACATGERAGTAVFDLGELQ